MFTGIIRERGRVAGIKGDADARHFRIEAPATAPKLSVGDSVSVDGCCLTATEVADGEFAVTAVPETISRTTLGGLAAGDEVNLETATRAGEPLGGHYVQGHVYCVEKGSIAVGGVSLTISALDDGAFEVALIPHTLEQTTLGGAQPGDAVNLEVDILAKYVEKLVHPGTITGA